MGRTGKLFAHQWAGIEPDVMSIAKGIAGGFPMGAILAREHVAKVLVPGSHGTTFGGSPLACAAANAVLDVVLETGFLERVRTVSTHLRRIFEALVARHGEVFTEVRGFGLILGLKCAVPNAEVQNAAAAEGLLTVAAGENVLRMVPPLIVTQAECDEAFERLDRAALRVKPALVLEAAK
jgi:acetylornithine/N-succinyldiaminopimelate aminotransferase